MELWICRGNEKLAEEALSDAARGDMRSIARRHLTAILKAYLLSVAFILIALSIGIPAMTWVYPRLAPIIRGLTLLYVSSP